MRVSRIATSGELKDALHQLLADVRRGSDQVRHGVIVQYDKPLAAAAACLAQRNQALFALHSRALLRSYSGTSYFSIKWVKIS